MNDESAGPSPAAEAGPGGDFSAWVQRHFDLVYSAALRQLGGDVHRARDAAQLVFIAAARKRAALARHPAAVGWLYTATHFAVRKMIREEIHRRERERIASELLEPDPAAADWAAIRPHLDAAMLSLGGADRAALLLRYFEQRSYAEVGASLALGENAARMRVERALGKLRRRLTRRGVGSSAAALAAVLSGHAVAAAPAGMGAAIAGTAAAEASGAAIGGAGLVLHFMASKLTLSLVAAAGLIAGSGAYLAFRANAAAAAARALDRESSQLQTLLGGLSGQDAREEGRLAALRAAPAPATAKPAPSRAAAQALLQSEIAENPQLRAQLARMLMASFRLEYRPLARSLGLSDAQFDRVGMLNLKLRSDLYDAEQAARLAGADPERDSGLQLLEQQARARYDSAVRAAVGDEAASKIEEFDRVAPARAVASRAAAAMAYTASPLTPAQADQMVRLMTDASPDYRRGGTFDSHSADWDRILAQAGDTLPPAAVASLRSQRGARDIDAMEDAAEKAGEAAP